MRTAFFNLQNHQLNIYARFLAELEEHGLPPEDSIEGILNHEVGHYVVFPHDLANHIYLLAMTDEFLPKDEIKSKSRRKNIGFNVYNYYSDICVNLDCLASSRRKHKVAKVYETLLKIEGVSAIDKAIAEVYVELAKADIATRLTDKERELVKELKGIDYLAKWNKASVHATNLISFGKVLEKKLREQMEEAEKNKKEYKPKLSDEEIFKKIPKYMKILEQKWPRVISNYAYPLLFNKPEIIMDIEIPMPNEGGDGDGDDEGDAEEGNKNKGRGKGKGKNKNKQKGNGEGESDEHEHGSGCCDGCGDLDDYSNDDINNALDDIIRRHDKTMYDIVHDFVKRVKKDFKDRFENKEKTDEKSIGTSSVDRISWNDDLVPFYKRKAAGFGIYILPKLMKDDSNDMYKNDKVAFEIDDEFQKIDPYSSPFLLPDISQRWREKSTAKTDLKYKIPDLFVMLDTSGSMTDPKFDSNATLSTMVLGKNYHANGAKIGIGNFSTDILLVPPGRDIELFFRVACAYWGGGTVLNLEKIKEWFYRLNPQSPLIEASTKADYEKMIEKIIKEDEPGRKDLKQFEEKHLRVKIDRRLPDIYEKLDNVLISDGAIANIEEIVRFFNSLAKHTRNTVFLINSPHEYEAWQKLPLEKTTIYHIEKPEDLLKKTIGRVKQTIIKRA